LKDDLPVTERAGLKRHAINTLKKKPLKGGQRCGAGCEERTIFKAECLVMPSCDGCVARRTQGVEAYEDQRTLGRWFDLTSDAVHPGKTMSLRLAIVGRGG